MNFTATPPLPPPHAALLSYHNALGSCCNALLSYHNALLSYRKVLDSYRKALDSYCKALDSYRNALDSYSKALDSYRKALDSYRKALGSYSKALDSHHDVLLSPREAPGKHRDMLDKPPSRSPSLFPVTRGKRGSGKIIPPPGHVIREKHLYLPPKRNTMSVNDISKRIKQLKEEKNAIILAHYYTRPEIQDEADYLGDSLGLSRAAARTDARVIVFCGVHFMAETAAIISPGKKVLIPAAGAGCSLAESITGEDLLAWKERNPGGLVICYVNTSAEVKARADYCCTSSNAVKIARSLPAGRPVLFVPDKNLGAYVNKITGRDMQLWHGDCCVHERLTADHLLARLDEYPDATALVHPEINGSSDDRLLHHPRVCIASTAGMIEHARTAPATRFIVATELETMHQLRKNSPGKEFIPALRTTICGQMKKITLPRLLEALEKEQHEVRVPDDIRQQAWIPIRRMLEIK